MKAAHETQGEITFHDLLKSADFLMSTALAIGVTYELRLRNIRSRVSLALFDDSHVPFSSL